jgi:hypothetical protein
VERERGSDLHARIVDALERSEHAQRHSRRLIAEHAALHEALRATMERVQSESRARQEPPQRR